MDHPLRIRRGSRPAAPNKSSAGSSTRPSAPSRRSRYAEVLESVERMNYVFLAGIGNSEPDHWQSIWFRDLGGRWVEHADWGRPRADDWVVDLERAMRDVAGPKVLIGHSLGCLLAVEWAKHHRSPDVKGSFLVAVPDAGGPNFPKAAVGFAPATDGPPPLPALVVASTN